jgi:hypothetical protein
MTNEERVRETTRAFLKAHRENKNKLTQTVKLGNPMRFCEKVEQAERAASGELRNMFFIG